MPSDGSMRKRTKTELRHTAHHEAGHAVVGRVLGLTCGGVTIVPNYDEMTAGVSVTQVETSISDWEARGRWRFESMYRASIFILMAGREAEIVCLGHDSRSSRNAAPARRKGRDPP
jgi:ATP-dependent Zn protease